ncbi:hypothetical protein H2200_006553 [Cladophialophora chaetospira]|uniref:Uncharacterized protein n=1 Tax=Cladophialophora chaetospira TaxID=386627 RepID=A0AA38X8J6_9EURO|nr:hypothetical protein H2200_006553 [Cladophialophora chaetospira]
MDWERFKPLPHPAWMDEHMDVKYFWLVWVMSSISLSFLYPEIEWLPSLCLEAIVMVVLTILWELALLYFGISWSEDPPQTTVPGALAQGLRTTVFLLGHIVLCFLTGTWTALQVLWVVLWLIKEAFLDLANSEMVRNTRTTLASQAHAVIGFLRTAVHAHTAPAFTAIHDVLTERKSHQVALQENARMKEELVQLRKGLSQAKEETRGVEEELAYAKLRALDTRVHLPDDYGDYQRAIIQKKEQEIKELGEEISEQAEEIRLLKEELEDCKATDVSNQAEIKSLEKELGLSKAINDLDAKEVARLDAELDSCKTHLTNANKHLRKLRKEKAEQSAQLKGYENELEVLKEQLVAANARTGVVVKVATSDIGVQTDDDSEVHPAVTDAIEEPVERTVAESEGRGTEDDARKKSVKPEDDLPPGSPSLRVLPSSNDAQVNENSVPSTSDGSQSHSSEDDSSTRPVKDVPVANELAYETVVKTTVAAEGPSSTGGSIEAMEERVAERVASLNEANAVLKADVERAESAKASAEAVNATLLAAHESAIKERDEYMCQFEELRTELITSRESAASLEARLEEAQEKVASAEASETEQGQKLENARRELEEAQQKVTVSEQSVADYEIIKADLEESKKKSSDLETRNSLLESELTEFSKTELIQALGRFRATEETRDRDQNERNQARQERDNYKKESEDYKKESEDAQKGWKESHDAWKEIKRCRDADLAQWKLCDDKRMEAEDAVKKITKERDEAVQNLHSANSDVERITQERDQAVQNLQSANNLLTQGQDGDDRVALAQQEVERIRIEAQQEIERIKKIAEQHVERIKDEANAHVQSQVQAEFQRIKDEFKATFDNGERQFNRERYLRKEAEKARDAEKMEKEQAEAGLQTAMQAKEQAERARIIAEKQAERITSERRKWDGEIEGELRKVRADCREKDTKTQHLLKKLERHEVPEDMEMEDMEIDTRPTVSTAPAIPPFTFTASPSSEVNNLTQQLKEANEKLECTKKIMQKQIDGQAQRIGQLLDENFVHSLRMQIQLLQQEVSRLEEEMNLAKLERDHQTSIAEGLSVTVAIYREQAMNGGSSQPPHESGESSRPANEQRKRVLNTDNEASAPDSGKEETAKEEQVVEEERIVKKTNTTPEDSYTVQPPEPQPQNEPSQPAVEEQADRMTEDEFMKKWDDSDLDTDAVLDRFNKNI